MKKFFLAVFLLLCMILMIVPINTFASHSQVGCVAGDHYTVIVPVPLL